MRYHLCGIGRDVGIVISNEIKEEGVYSNVPTNSQTSLFIYIHSIDRW